MIDYEKLGLVLAASSSIFAAAAVCASGAASVGLTLLAIGCTGAAMLCYILWRA